LYLRLFARTTVFEKLTKTVWFITGCFHFFLTCPFISYMTPKEEAYTRIGELVERFAEQLNSYKRTDYNETQTRRDFIDPFFKALGWDIDNSQGYAEAYREVIHEDKIKVGHATKAPDYSFRLPGGKRLFFVEAKKPSVAVKDDIYPAYQVRRYGWSAKLPVSIITDFEEFAVYDCLRKPNPTDKASVARIKYLTFRDYLTEFELLWDTFSKERVLKGSFDRFVQGTAGKKGTATVDREFLLSLDKWRTYLATSISIHNKSLDEDELNFAVQQTIDRIIFLRIAEDRSVEPYGNLKEAVKHGELYQNLLSVFREADQKYNSGLFDFTKDRISEALKVDNKVIKTIVNELYYPESPYEFSVLSVEILGSAYEQFLGKTISIDKGHRARIEEKPEVRKAGGVYYTPQYVVEYIVQNTVGKLVEGKTPGEVSALRIVDPACGSGSFLIGAYQYLLEWHKNYYTARPPKGKKNSPLTPDGHLSTAEKKRILLNNIYGVDIDVNAVEVTKLSLLLRCMEGETQASISYQMSMFNERVLPTLDNNIKSGNSLIDTDFYDTQLDFGEEKKVKPFNWQKAFPEVFAKAGTEQGRSGGFDAVIGNPPWGADLTEEMLHYLRIKHQPIIVRMVDSYMYFIDKSINILNNSGYLGMIIPSTFLNQSDLQLLRKKIIENYNIQAVINLGDKVFGKKVLNTSTVLIVTKADSCSDHISISDLRNINPNEKPHKLKEVTISDSRQWIEMISADPKVIFITSNDAKNNLYKRLKKDHKAFKEIIEGEIQRGISPDYSKAFILSNEEAISKNIEHELLKPLVIGKHIQRYTKIKSNDYIIYLTAKDKIEEFPNAREHLHKFKDLITCKEVKEGKHPWYSLHRPRNPEIFLPDKFIGLTTTKKLCLVLDEEGYYSTDALFVFKSKPNINMKAILAVFNSSTFQYLYDYFTQGGQRVIPQVKAVFLYDLPFPNLKNKEIELEELVIKLMNISEELQSVTLETRREQLQAKIDYCEERVNRLVYELYGLTEEEIAIVEKG
jgi:type I restriction-modification system DNA methylase subunit